MTIKIKFKSQLYNIINQALTLNKLKDKLNNIFPLIAPKNKVKVIVNKINGAFNKQHILQCLLVQVWLQINRYIILMDLVLIGFYLFGMDLFIKTIYMIQ
jgi:hypothetical protein